MRIPTLLFAVALLVFTTPARADDATASISIKDHQFNPTTLTVPANTRVKLTVKNQDASPEEFESTDLDIEKIIPASSEGYVYITPQSPGKYHFFGDFHQATAQGDLIAK